MGWWFKEHHVEGHLVAACPFLRDSITVKKNIGMTYNEIGSDFLIDFHSVVGSLQKIEVLREPNDPIIGDGDEEGLNIIYSSEIVKTYGPNIFYDALPFEMLKTIHVKPQVKVTVDGIAAVCASTKCDFELTESPSTVDSV